MNIAQLVAGSDTGGQTGATSAAFSRYAPQDPVRNVLASTNYLQYPTEGYERWKSSAEFRGVAASLYRWSDISLFTNSLELYHAVDHGEKKPTVIIHRGTRYRSHPEAVYAEGARIGAVQVVSTVDLLLAYPDKATWLPLITDMDVMTKARDENRRRAGRTLRISHAPTNRAIKGTESVIAAVKRLSEKYDVELDLIENQPWAACLSRKATADIFIDQMQLGYGNNALEAWAMGIPVVAGATPDILAKMRSTFGNKTLPFVSAQPRTLYSTLERLVKSKAARVAAADIGMAHTLKFHAAEQAVPVYQAFFRSVPPSLGTAPLEEVRSEIAMREASGRYVPMRLRNADAEHATEVA